MESLWLVDSDVFQHPFTCLIAGPTQSGKTHFLKNILLFNKILINPAPDKIIYCYSSWQPIFEDLKNTLDIQFCEGIINLEDLNKNSNNLVILDDLLNECENDSSILNLFTVGSHHKNTSVYFISQNLFSKGRFYRTISLNCNYMIIFKNPRDKSQINVLARQIFPNNISYFLESYTDAVENKSFSYLLIDLKQATLDKNRVQTGIIPGEKRIIYTPK
jgi:hypothetical protein